MLQRRPIEYRHGSARLEGLAVWDDRTPSRRPGILVVHEWKGLGPYLHRHANALADLGYVVLAADMYGRGIRPQTDGEARTQSHIYRDNRPLMRERAMAGLEALRVHPLVDRERIAAIGFSFGGCTVLELARSGAPLKGVVSFYGYLDTPDVTLARNIRGRVLILHGALDPVVPFDDVLRVGREMADAGVDCQINVYTTAAHGFSNPEVGTNIATGSAYDPEIDRRTWEAAVRFLAEALDRKP